MKTSAIQKGTQNDHTKSNTQRPEIRDNLDSRKNEEYDFKGDDITHNTKAKHNKNKHKD